MGKIYRGASEVLIWLGHKAEESDLAFNFMNIVAEDTATPQVDSNIRIDKPTAEAIRLLCYRDYWFRAWVR
jgi:hypothetical protein